VRRGFRQVPEPDDGNERQKSEVRKDRDMLSAGAIIGIGETKVGRHPGRTALELQAEAVRLALADARLEKSEIDAVYALASYIKPITMWGLSLVEFMGIRPRFEGNFDIGGTVAFMSMARDALAAIGEGRIDVAVCVYGDNASTRRVAGSHGFVHQIEHGTEDFEDPFGGTLVASYALVARRYLDRYGLDATETFGPVALALRAHAQRNENAAYRKPITMEDYRASEMIAEPLRRLDSSPVVDGAGAFVIASRRIIEKLRSTNVPVSVLGVGTQATHKIVCEIPDVPDLGIAPAGKRAFEEAGIGHADVDVLTVHDGFTSSIPITIEGLGFCPPGRAGEFVAGGGIDLGGDLPTNTHGGLLSQGHVGGMLHVIEAVRQLRGEAGERQVEDAEIAVVSGNGGIYSMCGAMVLGKGL
jgi:acetyl-CoA acetyltransferase